MSPHFPFGISAEGEEVPLYNWLHTHANEDGTLRAAGVTASVADGGTIAHGLGATPRVALANASEAGEFVSVTTLDETNITVAIKKHDGTAGTTQTIYWIALV